MKDIIIFNTIEKELKRQRENIELIASENFASIDVMKAQGSVLTNKYAEGYPNKRYYGGCKNVDIIEQVAIDRLKEIFNVKYANVQPHSGSSANMAVYKALLNLGDKVLSMNLSDGGHLTHGHHMSFSGKEYDIVFYGVNENGYIDYDKIEELAIKEKPKMILAGASAYPRKIDFKRMRQIADKVNAYLFVDMAHIAGLVATNLHQSPIPYSHVVTSTTHKTMRGPRGGFILTNDEEIAKKIDKIVFPGIQGGPLMHVIAAKAVSFYEAMQPEFIKYQTQVLKNSKALAESLMSEGAKVITNGTDNHLLLVDVKKSFNITGKQAEKLLDEIHITCNKNMVPFDTEKPFTTSGIRLGSPAMTTRGLTEVDFKLIGKIIYKALSNHKDETILNECKTEVLNITSNYPLYK